MEPAKIIIRYTDGGIIRGYTHDFSPDKPTFYVTLVDTVAHDPIEVQVKDLKAIFFVRDFMGNRLYREQKTFPDGTPITGRKVEVTFKDQEVLCGFVWDYDPNRYGFFLYPSDPFSNNLKIFAVSRAVDKVNDPS
ncbi:MAG: hypothetical protein OEW45_00945 [Deltaproteobacteria bacterium]|nr:hypothetical protein [Deltaproteobacteria bacterium]